MADGVGVLGYATSVAPAHADTETTDSAQTTAVAPVPTTTAQNQPTTHNQDKTQAKTELATEATAPESADTSSQQTSSASSQTVDPSTMTAGWNQVNSNWYYQQNHQLSKNWQWIDNNWYYFNPTTSAMETGLKSINSRQYYLNERHDGTFGAMQTGWQNISGHWYYFNRNQNDGSAVHGWQSINGQWYYFQNNGQAATAWQGVAGHWYYFDPRNANLLSGWQYVGNTWFYLNPNHDGNYGAMRAGWQWLNGHWYYLNTSHDGTYGVMLTGLRQINGSLYYLSQRSGGPQGAMQTGWQELNGNWYYFANSGAATRNWVKLGNDWYYFDPLTNVMQTGLQRINGTWYYLNTKHDGTYGAWRTMQNGWLRCDGAVYYIVDGQPLTGTQTIDRQQYHFDQEGRLMKSYYGKVTYNNGQPSLSIYRMADDKLIATNPAGTWENAPYSLDSSSINNINGYLSYTGWYRPIGTSADGKNWYPTSASDWRPILMYAWPSKAVEAQFIQYFVNHGYTDDSYGLTSSQVANLSAATDQTTLDQTAQNLRYVIEQHIDATHSTGQLANDINAFCQTVPALNAASELSYTRSESYQPDNSGAEGNDQVIFENNDSTNQTNGNTSYADDAYRLIDRTIINQTGGQVMSPEFLMGVDIDNSNPTVQAENFNWEYFLLNYGKLMGYNSDGNFDGFRIDAAANMDADVLDQIAQLMNDMYHIKGNDANADQHLLYNEDYHTYSQQMLDSKGSQELYMDSGYYNMIQSVLGRSDYRASIGNLATNSIVDRANDNTENQATPNWSFVMNHDQRKNVINQIILDDHPDQADVLADGYRDAYAQEAWNQFYADQGQTDKAYAQYNVPAQYAIMLTNKDTVPQVYYGDLYKETDPYMQTRSMYYNAITTLLRLRKEYVSGGQAMTTYGNNLLASVRYGKGVMDADSQGTDPLSRTTGIAVVVGNDPQMSQQTIAINMGVAHANQTYRNAINTTTTGLTYDNGTVRTDDNGILHVTVQGYANPYVSGYLGVWVPVISGSQDASTAVSQAGNDDKFYRSNAALDSHVIYEDFSLYQPEPTSQSNRMYNVLQQNAQQLADMGITDVWMAPAYNTFSMSRYHEGYSVTDRYDLGTASNPTKYGTGQELADAIAALHKAGMKVQEDLVMNQMLGLSGQEAVTVTRANQYGAQVSVDGKTFKDQIYFAYTRGGGQGQRNYGGKYLAQLQRDYPDLFTTPALSTGKTPDPTTKITEWSAKYENGTSLQNLGIGLAVKLPNGHYAYLNSGDNKAFTTALPDAMTLGDYIDQN